MYIKTHLPILFYLALLPVCTNHIPFPKTVPAFLLGKRPFSWPAHRLPAVMFIFTVTTAPKHIPLSVSAKRAVGGLHWWVAYDGHVLDTALEWTCGRSSCGVLHVLVIGNQWRVHRRAFLVFPEGAAIIRHSGAWTLWVHTMGAHTTWKHGTVKTTAPVQDTTASRLPHVSFQTPGEPAQLRLPMVGTRTWLQPQTMGLWITSKTVVHGGITV